MESDFHASKAHLLLASDIQNKSTSEYKNEKIYQLYLTSLLKYYCENRSTKIRSKAEKIIYTIGESHTLSSHELRLSKLEKHYICKSLLILGCKQWHLGNDEQNRYKFKFENIFRSIPKASLVLLSVGEIDCRIDEGLIKHSENSSKVNLEELIHNTVTNYINYVTNLNKEFNHKIIIQGVPCPNIEFKKYDVASIEKLAEVIKIFNRTLNELSKQRKFNFLDLYSLTNDGEGFSNGLWHIDTHHVSPSGMLEAWDNFQLSIPI